MHDPWIGESYKWFLRTVQYVGGHDGAVADAARYARAWVIRGLASSADVASGVCGLRKPEHH